MKDSSEVYRRSVSQDRLSAWGLSLPTASKLAYNLKQPTTALKNRGYFFNLIIRWRIGAMREWRHDIRNVI